MDITDVNGIWLVEGLHTNMPILVAAGVVFSLQGVKSGCIPIRMINPQPTEATVHQGKIVAAAQRLEEWMLAPIKTAENMQAAERTPEVPQSMKPMLCEIVEHCEEDLTNDQREQLYHLLVAYADIRMMAWGGRVVLSHTIDTGNHPPIRQPYRRIPAGRGEQTHQLIQDMGTLSGNLLVHGCWSRRKMDHIVSEWTIGC